MFLCTPPNCRATSDGFLIKKLRLELLLQTVHRKTSQSAYKYILSAFVFLSAEAMSADGVVIEVQSDAVTTPSMQDAPGGGGFPISITGTGVFGVTGISTYTGTTTIGGALGSGLGGNLLVTGRVGTPNTAFTVAPTGMLMGSGAIVGTVINTGNLSPSNNRAIPTDTGPPLAIGTTLTITGSYTQAAAAFLKFFATPSFCDSLSVNGPVICAGTLVIIPSGNYPSSGTTFRILNWGSQTGTFAQVVNGSNLPISLVTSIDGTGMDVTISGASVTVPTSGATAESLTSTVGAVAISDGATVANTSGSQTVSAQVIVTGTSTFNTSAGATTNLASAITSAPGTTLNLSGGGTTTFSANNSSMQGNVSLAGSTATIGSGANLGSGALNLSGAGTTLNLGANSGDEVTLTNPITLTDTAAFIVPAGASAALQSPITSAVGTTLNLSGGGTTTFAANNVSMRGDISVAGSTASITTGANLGSGTLNLSGAGTTLNLGANSGDAVTLVNPITLATSAAFVVPTGATAALQSPITSAPGTTLNLSGGGTTIFSANNSSMRGDISVAGSTASITAGANLGSGALNVSSGTIVMDSVALPNPISVNSASTFTSNAAPGSVATLSGAIIGSAPITFNGTGAINLTGASTSYTGTLIATGGKLSVNSNMPSAGVNLGAGAILGGAGTVGGIHQSGILKPGNSIGTLNVVGDYTTVDGAAYQVEINPLLSSKINVAGNTILGGTYFINVLMDAGDYPAQTTDYTILTTGGTLTVNMLNIKWNAQPGLSFTVGTLNDLGEADDEKCLVLRYRATQPFTIAADQAVVDTATLDGTYSQSILNNPSITLNASDVVGENSGLTTPELPNVYQVPVADHIELTSIVFSNNPNSQNDPASSATADAFLFKGFNAPKTTVLGGKNAVETLLTAISQNGPISYEKNETRLWISPYVNRSRIRRRSSDTGNQGWSGGSLAGIEQRDQKNIWSFGLLGGLMGSRSHTLGQPNTFSKSTGFLFGAYNTYKYTDYKDKGNFGHEILASRTTTFIDSQRYGLDKTDKVTPFYALATYKTTTNIINAQLNYLFDIIKKSVTSRLSAGVTYQGTQSGRITERNAGVNGITTSPSTNNAVEYYSGIGIRKIWNTDEITMRTTFVYEYGYQAMSAGVTARSATQDSVAPATGTTPIGPRQNKHYLQLNTSYLDRRTGLKFIVSYSGVLYKNVTNQTGMFKIEYRF